MNKIMVTIDGNEAAAYIAYHVNEVMAIYPITPSSAMGELADEWASNGEPNIWGIVPQVIEMQSEGGAAGAVHGSLQRGALTTTFTASQGLLLMIPNMFKIAGELTPTVFCVSARTIATHALSIFCDHSDVMAARSTGFALLSSNCVQEVMDFTLIAQAATLESRIPFLHFFDGFRTSHEIMKIEQVSLDQMQAMIDEKLVQAHRDRALSPDHPFIRGTAQNPDVFFQGREASNPYYLNCPRIVQEAMDKFAKISGRRYRLFEYAGDQYADRVIVIMGSGAETVQETVEYLAQKGEKVGLLKVRLYRPFSIEYFIEALPDTVKIVTVLDRTKEPGSVGEPLYLDVVAAISEAASMGIMKFKAAPRVIGGRYGLSSKEFTPAMVKGIFDEMQKSSPKNHFTIGINDDVTHTSLQYEPGFSTHAPDSTRAVFFGLGSDGTVSANKNAIKIIGEETNNYVQGYFVYDSKKAGSITVSHLRFGPEPIHSAYLIDRANFIACHQFSFIGYFDILKTAEHGAVFLLNSPYGPDEVWGHLPYTAQQQIIDKRLRFFIINASNIARDVGLGSRINTIMQTCFFLLTDIIPRDKAIEDIKLFIKKTYGKRNGPMVEMNFSAVDRTENNLYKVKVPDTAASVFDIRLPVPPEAPEFVQTVIAKMIAGEGNDLPVSVMPVDGTFQSGTTQWEKRGIALEIPEWDPEACIQCGRCVLVCPHAAIRSKLYSSEALNNAPKTFKSSSSRIKEFKDACFSIQVSPEDCTGCVLCVNACLAKNKKEPQRKAINMSSKALICGEENKNWKFFLGLPEVDKKKIAFNNTRNIQFLRPLFEFSGACAGCGETPYLKLLSQLFGDHLLIANATGCSSIYGGNLPTIPWAVNSEGRGPAWSNSLFEDNAEFGMGMRLALDKQFEYAIRLLGRLSSDIGIELVEAFIKADQSSETGITEQRKRVEALKEKLKNIDKPTVRELLSIAEVLVKKSVWIVGGDGWAYDIDFGGLDHVLASGSNVKVLVLDTEVYSNTGGQMSKSTPRGAIAKFAAKGKPMPKKDLAMMAMMYGTIYVAVVAIGANDAQAIKAFIEAEAYHGPSLIIAYSHCTAHGYELSHGMDQQKKAVLSGYWPLMRYNPDLRKQGKNPLQLDSGRPSIPLEDYINNETRYRMLGRSDSDAAKKLLELARQDILERWHFYEYLSTMPIEDKGDKSEEIK